LADCPELERPGVVRRTLFAASSSGRVSSDVKEGLMRPLSLFRSLFVGLVMAAAAVSSPGSAAETQALASQPPGSSANIVIGFVGGFVAHDNPHHGPVQLAYRIRQTLPPGTYIRTFENRHRKQAYSTIVRLLDANRDGVLSPEEKSRARIILLGQSWGASAAVLLARDLRREGVPVLLTVQVDSVAKVWQNDSVIPDNVAEAINFYQPHGLVHGRRHIKAADPSKTEILGNYLVDYRKHPINCPDASWADRLFTPSHMQSECDPRLWSQVEDLVRQRLVNQDTSAQTLPSFPAALGSQR
jgi:pimeloyl-ACP methyl ester carboxylesterase